MNSNEKYEKIHLFLAGKMNADEEVDFKNQIQVDDTLRMDVELEKNMIDTMTMASDKELRSTIKAVHNQLKEQDFFEQEDTGAKIVSINKLKQARIFLVAAAAIAILIFAWWTFKQSTGVDTEGIYVNYFSPEAQASEDYESTLTGFTGEKESAIIEGLNFYQAKEYDKAREAFDEIVKKYPDAVEAELFLALSNSITGNREHAIDKLRMLSIENFDYQDEAKWHLALLLIEDKEGKEEARDIFLGLISDPNSKYNERAASILNDLHWDQ